MKKLFLTLMLLLMSEFGFSQVGINTTTPDAQLDIKSSNQATPANNDGILIPKIDAFPSTNPTVAQNSMMVYLTTDFDAAHPKGFYYWDNNTSSWKSFGAGSGWSLTGDAGTNPTTNFIGTIDDNDVIFKRNSITAGRLSSTNTSFGLSSLQANSTGFANSAFGFQSLVNNDSGHNNVSIGIQSMQNNNSGFENVAIGTEALSGNTWGYQNVAIGFKALNLATATGNTAIGARTLTSNTNGYDNLAMGITALNVNTEGYSNTAIGGNALDHNVLGYSNVALGSSAGNGIINGSNNLVLGQSSNVPLPNGNFQMSIANVIYGTDMSTTALGKIGIGVSAPTEKLQVSDNIKIGNNAWASVTNNRFLKFGDGDYVTIGEEIADDFLSFKASNFLFNPSSGYTGNVGIGVLSATEKLEVAGKTKTTNLQVTNGAAAGQVLLSDALGNATWQNPTSFGWSLTGNAGTNTATNFLGTTDDIPLNFRINNVIAGKIERSTFNSFLGYNSGGSLNATSISNTAIGYEALRGSAVVANNTGGYNNCLGYSALYKNSTGSNNLAFGSLALASNTTGSGNLAFGNYAMSRIVEGSSGITIGHFAMYYFSGPSGPFTNTNTAIGTSAMRGEHFGSLPGSNNIGLRNTVLGYNVLEGISSGNDNTIAGFEGSFLNKTGSNNTGFGSQTLYNNVAGDSNVAIGYQAGFNTTGSNNITIGSGSNVVTSSGSNQLSIANVIYGENMDNMNTAYLSLGALPNIRYKLYNYNSQLTANGDGQYGVFSYRTRDSQNDGTSYSITTSNAAIGARNYWGDSYTFGISGFSDNDFNRSGGIMGSETSGTYWSSLGYKNSAGTTYGVYATAALATGAGRYSQPQSQYAVGGGFYGGLIGSWSKGSIIGNINSGDLFASYNSGDEYTHGKQIEIVTTQNSKIAAYTVTSTEVVIYKKGKTNLTNGSARVNFDDSYSSLLGDIPIVTTSPMGQCNGIYIESVDKTGFTIKELNNGTSNITISWISVGDRIDSSEVSSEVLNQNFDDNINQVMFNENNTHESATGIWSQENKIHFGTIPENLKEKSKKE